MYKAWQAAQDALIRKAEKCFGFLGQGLFIGVFSFFRVFFFWGEFPLEGHWRSTQLNELGFTEDQRTQNIYSEPS